jgi:hypothetical protein
MKLIKSMMFNAAKNSSRPTLRAFGTSFVLTCFDFVLCIASCQLASVFEVDMNLDFIMKMIMINNIILLRL